MLHHDETELKSGDIDGFASFVGENIPIISVAKSGLTVEELIALFGPVSSDTEATDSTVDNEGDESEQQSLTEKLFRYIVPFSLTVILYFMCFAYGQGLANNVVIEKTSKLMDTFLVMIKPESMILGKILAIATSGVIQIMLWIVGVVGGLSIGVVLVEAINPDTTMGLVNFLRICSNELGIFSVGGFVAAILMICVGFLTFCSLSAVGGASASKQEDVGVTNVLFTVVLMACYFLYLTSIESLIDGGTVPTWQFYVPFMSMMTVPSAVLMGDISVTQSLVPMAISFVCMLVLVKIAGTIYTKLCFYKGKTLKPWEVFKLK
jgi:ABC-type Na+ efflux pump permease subunit